VLLILGFVANGLEGEVALVVVVRRLMFSFLVCGGCLAMAERGKLVMRNWLSQRGGSRW
jgi:hypothetical protein